MYATAFMDGLDTAFSDFNAEGDMGDAEVWEQQMPQVFLVREIRKDGGGFGKFRGGSGIHTLYIVPEGIEMDMGAFGSPPIFSTAGIMGGYPAPALRVWVGRNSNLSEVIASGAPLPSSEGDDPVHPDFVRLISADWEFIHGQNYPARGLPPGSLFSVVSGDGGGYGDPLERDPAQVARDFQNGLTTARAVREVYGVVMDEVSFAVDQSATRDLRSGKRRDRLARGIPASAYKQQMRERVLAHDFPQPAAALYQDVLKISKKFAAEFRTFWDLPEDYAV
jgi:N-methylhydantoinase B/oxoprolinase/acetone carboxylase alpha subunit